MSTRSRIGYVLQDDSILSVYHHWDGYPEWLGVTLEEHYNTDETVRELIDGGNMSSCFSTSKYNKETEEFEDCEGHVEYYGGKDEGPVLSKNLDELAQIDCGSEFLYIFLKGKWHAYETDITHDDETWKVTGFYTKPVEIPKATRTV